MSIAQRNGSAQFSIAAQAACAHGSVTRKRSTPPGCRRPICVPTALRYAVPVTPTSPDPPEIEELERAAAWRLRLVDADPADHLSRTAAELLQALADDLRRLDLAPHWIELRSLCNWLAESDAISDYADLAAAYRARIGVTDLPRDGADYLRGLLTIAQSLV